MAVLPVAEEPRVVGKANARERVGLPFFFSFQPRGVLIVFILDIASDFRYSVRLAPPLVISEEDLAKAVRIIGECLVDIDELENIPGDVGSEKGQIY